MNPLAVKTKTNLGSEGIFFLEAQLQNITPTPMVIERLHLEPIDPFKCTDLNAENIIDGGVQLSPNDIRQYLFMLSPKSPSDETTARVATVFGKLDIQWRTSMGELGRLQTSQLTRRSPVPDTLEVKVITSPTIVTLEHPFVMDCEIWNHGTMTASIQLSIVKTRMGSVLFVGSSVVDVGDVLPKQSQRVQLRLFPLSPGLQRVEGLRLVDIYTGNQRDLDGLADVYVQKQNDEVSMLE
jgi:hypothetical protein